MLIGICQSVYHVELTFHVDRPGDLLKLGNSLEISTNSMLSDEQNDIHVMIIKSRKASAP